MSKNLKLTSCNADGITMPLCQHWNVTNKTSKRILFQEDFVLCLCDCVQVSLCVCALGTNRAGNECENI